MSKANQHRFTQKLHEQLGFMQRSCIVFDQGAEEEAFRIATSLRVIFRDKGRSISLVTHLGLRGSKMLSSSRGLGDWRDYLSHELDINSPQPIRMVPLLGDKFIELSVEDWWQNEPVFIHEEEIYPRQTIVLSAAEKDGGAHVDKELERYYEVLCAGKYAFGITGSLEYNDEPPFPQGITQYPKNAHLALIRQFAHEVLISAVHYVWLKSEI